MSKDIGKKEVPPVVGVLVLAVVIVAGIIGLVLTSSSQHTSNSPSTATSTSSKETALEKKLGATEALSACQIYGQRNYKDFNIHMIAGKIAEYAADDNTWLFKYYVDADGHENRNMECYVTGTSESPVVSRFLVY